MRSSIPTSQEELEKLDYWLVSQSLLNEVKYSNMLIQKLEQKVQTKSQSLLNEVKYSNLIKDKAVKEVVLDVAIPFKWGQVFQPLDLEKLIRILKESQSLLNEVKFPTFFHLARDDCLDSRNPF